MHWLFSLAGLSIVSGIYAQSTAYGQCGGIGWAGSTTCVSGYTCTVSNPYYSQCLPGAAPPPPPTGNPTTSQPSSTINSGTTTASSTATSTGPAPTGSQIRAVQAPVFHFYLQNNNGAPMLGPESSSGYFTIGGTIKLSNSSPTLYLNANTSVSTSYKPLTLDTTATTTDWGLEGDTIITTAPRQLNFIACATSDPNFFSLYLQEGNDTPAGQTCTLQTIHLPCLC